MQTTINNSKATMHG